MLKQAILDDLDLIYQIETTCFPVQEAASYQSLKDRLEVYPEGFEIFYKDQQPIGYIGGLKNNQCELPDKMYEDASLHQKNGNYQMIFSVCILPEYRRCGYARKMVKAYVEKRQEDVNGFILTCKDHLIPFYESCGFKFIQVSTSTHGNAKWNDMVIDCSREI